MTLGTRLNTYIQSLNARGGPREEDYFDVAFNLCYFARQGLTYTDKLEGFASILENTFFGKVFYTKQHGAFQILELMYTQEYFSGAPHLQRWDEFIYRSWTCQAVRNRVDFFQRFVVRRPVYSVLDVGCGSGRIVNTINRYDLKYRGVDYNQQAVDYCKHMYHDNTFIQGNILNMPFKFGQDFIWCSGVFDYFTDTLFVMMADRFLQSLPDGGFAIIGNLSPRTDVQCLMHIVNWHLLYRSKEHLLKLSEQLPTSKAWVESDRMGIQHYLILQK